MELNIKKFKEVVLMASGNYLMQNLHLVVNSKITSSMYEGGNMCLTSIKNDMININNNSQIDMYFGDIKNTVLPYISIIDNEIVDVGFYETHMIIKDGKNAIKIHFCDPSIVGVTTKTTPKIEFNIVLDYQDVADAYETIKKIAPRFAKIFIGRKKNELYFLTGDNKYSNNLCVTIKEDIGDDFEVVFDFNTFNKIFTITNENFIFKMEYVKERSLGLIFWEQNMNGDYYKYFFTSIME